MINKFLLWITKFMPAKAIDLDGCHYIERYRVFGVGRLEVLIHRYLGCDGDREVHDHPHRWCLGIPLKGGYLEERVEGFDAACGWISRYVKIRPWRWNFVNAMRFHRIAYVEPGTWTLFVRWNRFKGWQFAEKREAGVVLVQRYPSSDDTWHESAPRGGELRKGRGTE